jgi:hypothetical protein
MFDPCITHQRIPRLTAPPGAVFISLDLAPHAARAHPTDEHFLPLLVAAGAAHAATPVTVLDGGIRHGVIAVESHVFGQHLDLLVPQAFDEDTEIPGRVQ